MCMKPVEDGLKKGETAGTARYYYNNWCLFEVWTVFILCKIILQWTIKIMFV